MPELAALVLHLRAQHSDEIPGWVGPAAHAWMLASLRDIDPALSQIVHDEQGIKAFTVSNLIGLPPLQLVELRRDAEYQLRVTTLHPDLTHLTVNTLAQRWLTEGVRLHDQPFSVEQIVMDSAQDQWSGLRDYADFLDQQGLSRRALPRRLDFHFAAPTSFNRTARKTTDAEKRDPMPTPLPLPELVFGSLIDRWNKFASVALHPDLKTFVEQCVSVGSYRIQTRRISYERAGRGSVVGFTGDVTYQVNSSDQFWLGQLHMLSAFALYCGVGVRTAQGLGQVRQSIMQEHQKETTSR